MAIRLNFENAKLQNQSLHKDYDLTIAVKRREALMRGLCNLRPATRHFVAHKLDAKPVNYILLKTDSKKAKVFFKITFGKFGLKLASKAVIIPTTP